MKLRESGPRPADLVARCALVLFGAAGLGGLALVLGIGLGSGYYAGDLDERAAHPLHEWLRAGGPIGVLLGVVGTILMTAMLAYTVRKALGVGPRAARLGSPAGWLTFHMACGVLGPLAIVVHTGLQWPSGLVAVGFWCMVLVALSGAFGRFVYGHFPRTAAGKAMDLREARAALAELRATLLEETSSTDAAALGRAVALVHDFHPDVRSIGGWVALDLEVRRRSARVRKELGHGALAPGARREVGDTLLAQLRLQRDLGAWEVSRRLFRWWHLLHQPLALAMYAVVAIHVTSALVFGGALAQLAVLVP